MHCFRDQVVNAFDLRVEHFEMRWRLTLSSHQEAVWRVTTAS